ncbi:colicin immunity domain-containing protein [Kutzneria sp. CA-103260]|uniref:colicin immunity domain-containing protein n=1 Tax=Kutzneria sp. CA-103260 TaxID=2802641 RepID=UPI001BA75020|nr:colicin immunity domain-containing protein [Kutzneria sp. CA-103260]QUQ64007.1 Bacterial self-protective colicin-like immunity [Kutzneria sp. CA-103260]
MHDEVADFRRRWGAEAVVPLAADDLTRRLGIEPADTVVEEPDGAVLVTTQGYGLVGGTPDFVRGHVPEGSDEARARFARYARRTGSSVLIDIAAEFPPLRHSWSRPADVDPDSNVAEQLELMRSLADGRILPADFARRWLAARLRSLSDRERTRSPLTEMLNRMFYALDDYAIDPSVREPGDLTDEELTDVARTALEKLAGA